MLRRLFVEAAPGRRQSPGPPPWPGRAAPNGMRQLQSGSVRTMPSMFMQ